MSELIFVAKTPMPKKCNTCGKMILQDEPSFWDKTNKRNYHEDCKPDALSELVVKGVGGRQRTTFDTNPSTFEYDIEAEYNKLSQEGYLPQEAIELSRQKFELALANWKVRTWKK